MLIATKFVLPWYADSYIQETITARSIFYVFAQV
jgi:hypothetical protein